MDKAVYILCALTSTACAALLWRKYSSTKARLLFWSALCFAGLGLNNVLLCIDFIVLPPEIDLSLFRNLTGLLAIATLLFGLVWESK